eukprot:CAMPEP_0172531858 /NCGR_PEP_ID=MMETSP1067-20121228/5097_1 /TAXON_ID=265564 ORGANISM="Thalassiosira punctigera, Strain Tpunct2005C2" /NCGR_SAMPLE_ID=MMETSP1067 /ASSEMBLY_ACC=CAM_ASM_000444 /LENGTH=344 /DNA_ID=CAMNT_0013316295 /DNA_START=23 /DNA_END=1057 /DNA_ORIENTATION=+
MWKSKNNVADANANEAKLDATLSSARPSRRKNSGGKRADRQLREFFDNLGASFVDFIDATPFGVPTPAPWSPDTDRKKAMLSNPISVLQRVSETVDALFPGDFFAGAMEGGSAWIMASSKMLMSLREGLANAVLAEEAMGRAEEEVVDFENKMVTVETPVPAEGVVVPSEAGSEAFVDLGANKSRVNNALKEALSEAKAVKEVTANKILTFIDRLTLRTNGIVVTSDDCSVECSLDSLVERLSPSSSVPGSVSCDEDDFEDCPSVVTEIAIDELEDELEETKVGAEVLTAEVMIAEDDQVSEDQEVKTTLKELIKDEDEYVMTEEPDSDEDDFVDVRAEFDATP